MYVEGTIMQISNSVNIHMHLPSKMTVHLLLGGNSPFITSIISLVVVQPPA